MSFCIGFPRYFGVLDGYPCFHLCVVDLKFSGRGFATFQCHVRGMKRMLRGSVFRCAHHMHSTKVNWMEMMSRTTELGMNCWRVVQ